MPEEMGVKVTAMLQLAPAARLAPQVLDCAKSPLAVMLLIVNVPLPLLVSVTDCAALVVFKDRLLKVSELGDRLAAAVATPVPVTGI